VFATLVIFATNTSFASGNADGVEWRIAVAKYLEKNYAVISQMVDLNAAMLSNQDYKDKMIDELNSPIGMNRVCGDDFILVRAAKSKQIDINKAATTLNKIVSPGIPEIITSYDPDGRGEFNYARSTSELSLIGYSPVTAEAFLVFEEILTDEQVAILQSAFEKFSPLWGAILERQGASMDSGNFRAEIKNGLVVVHRNDKGSCNGGYAPSYFVPHTDNIHMGEPNTFYLTKLRERNIAKMSLAQLDYLESVLNFYNLSGLMESVKSYKKKELYNAISLAKSRALEDFSDLGGSPSASPSDSGPNDEFEDLNLEDLNLDDS
jgi:hypothetical protein